MYKILAIIALAASLVALGIGISYISSEPMPPVQFQGLQQHKLRTNYFSYYAVSPCTAEGIAKQ